MKSSKNHRFSDDIRGGEKLITSLNTGNKISRQMRRKNSIQRLSVYMKYADHYYQKADLLSHCQSQCQEHVESFEIRAVLRYKTLASSMCYSRSNSTKCTWKCFFSLYCCTIKKASYVLSHHCNALRIRDTRQKEY